MRAAGTPLRTQREEVSRIQSLVLLVVIALLSLLTARVATVALTATGLPQPSARFQARSALTGVGFTTRESESVVGHPVRRRIVMGCMLVGNIGLVGAMAGLLGTYVRADTRESLVRSGVLIAALAALYALSKSSAVDRHLTRAIGRVLDRFTDIDVRDFGRLLHLSGEFSVAEVRVEPGSPLDGVTLGEARVRDDGVFVLGIARAGGGYVGTPTKDTVVRAPDTVIVYGSDDALAGLGSRRERARDRA